MLTTMPYLIHYNIIHKDKLIYTGDPERDTKGWTMFLKLHIMSNVTFHTISVWLTVYLSCFRFFYLKSLFKNKGHSFKKSIETNGFTGKVVKIKNALQTHLIKYNSIIFGIIAIYIVGFIFCSPAYFYSTIKEETFHYSPNDALNKSKPKKYYYLDQSELNLNINDLLFNLMLYGQAIFSKLIPCLLILVFTSCIVHKLAIKDRNKTNLFKQSESKKLDESRSKSIFSSFRKLFESESTGSIKSKSSKEDVHELEMCKQEAKKCANDEFFPFNQSRKSYYECLSTLPKQRKLSKSNHARSTFMLVMVCFLFLLVELPITILTLLSISMSESFYANVFIPLAEFMDFSILVYTSINFVLYCAMSSMFRKALYELFSDLLYKIIIFFNLILRKFQNYEEY